MLMTHIWKFTYKMACKELWAIRPEVTLGLGNVSQGKTGREHPTLGLTRDARPLVFSPPARNGKQPNRNLRTALCLNIYTFQQGFSSPSLKHELLSERNVSFSS